MARGARTENIDNNGPAASVGTVQIINEFSIMGGEILTLDDGTNPAHDITFTNMGGGSTSAIMVDTGGGASAAAIAGHLVTAIGLANAAGDLDMTGSADGTTCTITHDNSGANNNALVHNFDSAAAAVSGMAGGSDDVGVPRFEAIDLTDADHANHAQAVFTSLTLKNNTTGTLRYGWDADADPTQDTGNWNTLTAGQSVTLSFTGTEQVQQVYLNGSGLTGVQYVYGYDIR